MIPWPVIRATLVAEEAPPDFVERVQQRFFDAGCEGVPDPHASTEPAPPPRPSPFDPFPIDVGHGLDFFDPDDPPTLVP